MLKKERCFVFTVMWKKNASLDYFVFLKHLSFALHCASK